MVLLRKTTLTYPVVFNAIDDSDTTSLADEATLDAFYDAAMDQVRTHRDAGTSLKDQVRAATTVSAVNAIVDNR